jgi:hypothetical protein
MNKPTPGQELIDAFIGKLKEEGGQLGNGKLRSILGWSEEDYGWVRDAMIERGAIRIGRGRGGSVQLLDETERAQVQATRERVQEIREREREKIAEAPRGDSYRAGPAFDLEKVKASYEPLQDINDFKVGMHIMRVPKHLFAREEDAWHNMKHYIVLDVIGDRVKVEHKDNTFLLPETVPPRGFYRKL